MKIAIIGNMNNMMTPTATYLASAGHDVTLFMLFEYDHFHPMADYWSETDLGFKIVNLNLEFGQVLELPKAKLKEWFLGFDFYLGMDWSPALLARIGVKLDFYQPAGTDIIYWPFCHYETKFYEIWQCQNLKRAWLQKYGISRAANICLSEENSLLNDALEKMRIPFRRKTYNLPHINVPLFLEESQIQRKEIQDKVNRITDGFDFVIFQHIRQWWLENDSPAHYRNDKTIRAFSAFLSSTRLKCLLLLCEYGPDVEKSKQLISDLGISDNVIWLPKMLRKEIMYYLRRCNLWIGELGDDSYIQYGSLIEAMICGKQVVSYWDKNLYTQRFDSLPKIISAKSEQELTAIMSSALEKNQELKIQENIQWVQEYIWNRPLLKLSHYIANKSNQVKFTLLEKIRKELVLLYYNIYIVLNKLKLVISKFKQSY